MRSTYLENGMRSSRSRRSEESMWQRAVNVSRLAPREIANSIKALTAPAATGGSRIAPSPATSGHDFDAWDHSEPMAPLLTSDRVQFRLPPPGTRTGPAERRARKVMK